MDKVIDVITTLGILGVAYVGGFIAAAKGLEMLGAGGKMIGGFFNKMGSAAQGKINDRKATNPYALRRQLNKETKKEQRLERGADSMNSVRGRATSLLSPSMLTQGGRQRRQRVNAQASQYTAEQQKKALGKINYQHAQALSMSGGDVDQALAELHRQGHTEYTRDQVADSKRALGRGGLDLNSASTAQALGDLAADSGTLLAGYGQRYEQIAGRGGAYQQALAAGTAQQWVRTTRKAGNFAADERNGVARLGSFSNTAESDIRAVLTRAAQNQAILNAGGTLNTPRDTDADARHAQDMDRLARYTAQAELAHESGDARMDEHRWGAVHNGRAALNGATGSRFDAAVAAERARIEAADRATTQL